jgi:hypothetical protein
LSMRILLITAYYAVGTSQNVIDSNTNSFNRAQLDPTTSVISGFCATQKFGYSFKTASASFVLSRLDFSVASALFSSVAVVDFLVEVWIASSSTSMSGPTVSSHAFGTVSGNASRGYTSLVLPSFQIPPNGWYAVTISPQIACSAGFSMYRSLTNAVPTAGTGITSITQLYSQDNGATWTAPASPFAVFRLVAAAPIFSDTQVRDRMSAA